MHFPPLKHLATWSDLARNTRLFGDLIEEGEPVLIMKHSRPIAVLVPVDPEDVTLVINYDKEGRPL